MASYNGPMNKPSWKLVVPAVAAVALLAGGIGWWTLGRGPDVSYRTAKIERGPLQATVSASGTVNPVTQVSVGTQVSGQIKELYVDFNSEVKAGQLIALIDPETFEYRVRQAQADVDAAQAAVLIRQVSRPDLLLVGALCADAAHRHPRHRRGLGEHAGPRRRPPTNPRSRNSPPDPSRAATRRAA